MKNNLSYYSRMANSHNHPKFKTLRAKYGWAGDGRFWALNDIVADSENCRLNIKKKYVRGSLAEELGMNLEEFDDFLEFIIDEVELFYRDGEFITNDHLLEDLERVMGERKSSRDRANSRKNKTSGENSNISGEKDKSSETFGRKNIQRERGEESRGDTERRGEGGKKISGEPESDLLPLPLNDSLSSLKTPESIISEAWNRKPKNNSEKKAFEQMISSYGYDETLHAMQIATSRSKPDDCLEFAGYVEGILKKGGTQEFKAYSKQELQELGHKRNTPNIFEFYVAVRLDERSSFEPFYVSKEDQRKHNLPVWIVKNKEEPLPITTRKQDWGADGYSIIKDVERLQQEAL